MTKYVIANWKMRVSKPQVFPFLQGLENASPFRFDVIVCPPFPFLEMCGGYSSFSLGAQTCSDVLEGPYTGEVSAVFLKDVGCTYVLVGHSERRTCYHETNGIVREKMYRVLEQGLIPILCIGEPLGVYEAGQARSYLVQQLKESLPLKEEKILVAYEPLWAIGTGKTPSLQDIEQTHIFLQQSLAELGWLQTPLLYGGSVGPENAKHILSLPSVAGVLVGGASTSLETLLPILKDS